MRLHGAVSQKAGIFKVYVENNLQNYCISFCNHMPVTLDITVYHPTVVYHDDEKRFSFKLTIQ
jgi:hypothetical protein